MFRRTGMIFSTFLLFSLPLSGTIMPNSYNLNTNTGTAATLNPQLSIWLSTGRLHSLFKGSFSEPKHDSVARGDLNKQYYKLITSKKVTNKKDLAQRTQAFSANVYRVPRNEWANIPLMPYFIEFISENNPNQNLGDATFVARMQASSEGFSCPSFDMTKKRLTDSDYVKQHAKTVKSLLRQLGHMKNPNKLIKVLDTFTESLNQEQWGIFRDEIRLLIKRHPLISKRIELKDKSLAQYQNENSANSNALRQALRAKRCFTARNSLKKHISTPANKLPFPAAKEHFESISQCFRRKGSKARLKMMHSFSPIFEKRYGIAGWGYIELEITGFHWNRNKFKLARQSLNGVAKRAKAQRHLGLMADSTYLRARIDENEQFYERAITGYTNFINKFPTHKSFTKAQEALVLAYAGQKKWPQVYSIATTMISKIKNEESIENSTSLLGFARFWAGRSAVETGKKDIGLAFWKIAARESFSSYYGAMSHYMMETNLGKTVPIQPAFINTFNLQKAMTTLSPAVKKKFDRAYDLISLGLESKAACELNELEHKGSSEQVTFLRSLFLNQTGDWLAAIKAFGSLPRAFRKSLPFGSERILFPKKYDQTIENYTTKLKIDPDLIYSLIRQESVFNPRAHSHAGARGLMQLLSRTARLEAKRLPRSYVSKSKKRGLLSKVRRKKNLFEVEPNIILGTHYFHHLLKRYQSLPFALAAYNAGPTVVKRWKKEIGYDDPLYFIEKIPYQETRSYVKLILRNYFYYKKWYGNGAESYSQLAKVTKSISIR